LWHQPSRRLPAYAPVTHSLEVTVRHLATLATLAGPASAARRATSLLAALGLLALPTGPRAEGPAPAPAGAKAPADAPFEMESFQLVLLVRAPTYRQLPDEEAKALQAAHLGHLGKMWETRKAVVCGPFGGQQDPAFRGACLYAVKTVEEARALAEADPVVKAGQLRIEAMTWWVGKGYMSFPKTPAEPTR
jgi:uncharacterized protein YciI